MASGDIRKGLHDASSVFGPIVPTGGQMSTKPPRMAFQEKTLVYLPPKRCTDVQRMSMAAMFILCCTSKGGSPKTWKTLVASYSALLFPSTEDEFPSDHFTILRPDAAQSATLHQYYTGFFDPPLDSSGHQTPPFGKDRQAEYIMKVLLPGLPPPDDTLEWNEIGPELTGRLIAGHYSIFLFLIGKRVPDNDHSSITTARPLAVKGKLQIDVPVSMLEGDMRISDHAHIEINKAWNASSIVRRIFITEFCKLQSGDTGENQEMVNVTMNLLQNSGMNHAKITYEFLNTYDWIAEIPTLRGALAVYLDSARKMMEYPAHLRPYVKLIYGDKAQVYPRNELDPLVACAVEAKKETSTTIGDFVVNEGYNSIVEAFLALRKKKEQQASVGEAEEYDGLEEEEEEGEEE